MTHAADRAWRLAPGLSWCWLDDEIAVFNPTRGTSGLISGLGVAIFDVLSQGENAARPWSMRELMAELSLERENVEALASALDALDFAGYTVTGAVG